MSRFILTFFVVLTLLISSGALVIRFLAQRAMPVTDGYVTLPSLAQSADVRFDECGVPYIQARSDMDALVAQGFVTASERMFQMDMLRRTAQGEMAEVYGQELIQKDKFSRTLGFNRLAKEEYKQLPAEMKSKLKAYCQGVNAYLESAANRMPFEFVVLAYTPRQWMPEDSLAILKYAQYETEESWQLDDLRQRVQEKGGDKLAALMFEQNVKTTHVSAVPKGETGDTRFDAQQALLAQQCQAGSLVSNAISMLQSTRPPAVSLPVWGSNAWVISAAMSDTKGCLLASDSHDAFTSPDRYFLCSLTSPEMHVAGATIPGVPGVVAGRNMNIGWASTALHADTQDLVVEQLSPQFPGKYKTTSGWDTTSELTEEISVKFASRPYKVKVQTTKHGPFLLQNENTAVAMQWTGFDTKEPVLKTLFEINAAHDWKEFNEALSHYSGAARTFMYADNKGNIGYHVAGKIPIRSAAATVVSTGWTGASDWNGFTKFDQLSHEYNPAQGFAVADDPQFVTTYYNNPLRALRVSSVLSGYKHAAQHVGLPEMALLQGDQTASFAAIMKKQLETVVGKAQIIDEYQVSALTLMRQWDGTLKPDSAAASIYESFLRTLTRRVLEPKLGAKITEDYLQRWPRWTLFTQKLLTEQPKDCLPPEERTYETFLITTFAQALKDIRLSSKNEDVAKCTWQSLHQIQFQPAIANGSLTEQLFQPLFKVAPVGVGGDQDAVDACNVTASIDPWNFHSDSGPAQRMLIDMSDNDKFYQSLTLGESGHMFSPYRTDQLNNWLHLAPHSVAFSSEQLDKQGLHKVTFINQFTNQVPNQ